MLINEKISRQIDISELNVLEISPQFSLPLGLQDRLGMALTGMKETAQGRVALMSVDLTGICLVRGSEFDYNRQIIKEVTSEES